MHETHPLDLPKREEAIGIGAEPRRGISDDLLYKI